MLWYGYIYYLVFNLILLISILYILRLFFLNSFTRLNVFLVLNRIFLSFLIFYLFVTLTTLNYLLDYNHDYLYLSNSSSNILFFSLFTYDKFFILNALNLNLYQTYYYPFIYIFLLITLLSIIFCLSYNIDEFMVFMFYTQIILLSGYILFFTNSLILFFLAYEMLLVPSFFILYKFAKTRRCVEAAYLMFFYTQFGAMFLIFSFIYIFLICDSLTFSYINFNFFSQFEINFIFITCLIGFGVKLPIWPFYGWLPKAHVEASTNFSIFLSGVLVKFAFFGLMKCLITVQLEPTLIYVYPFLIIGIIDAVFKLFYQIDLKKLVAYSTVVEMHWLTICIISGQSSLMLANFCMLISHALISTNSFLLVDAIARRFKTRLITEVSGINFLCPRLFLSILLNTLIFLGFPGSLFFIAEVLFFSFFFDLFPIIAIFLLIFLYLLAPSFFFRSWLNVMFSFSYFLKKKLPVDLSTREVLLFLGTPILMYWLGISWQSFII